MRAPRACGYCRDVGHVRPKCPMFHRQRADLHNHVLSEIQKVYKYLCEKGLGPNALINANALKWGASTSRPPLLAQIMPYDMEIPQRSWAGSAWKTTYAENLSGNLFRIKNVKYSKQVNVNHLALERSSIYPLIPMLYLDGSNTLTNAGLPLFHFYQGNLEGLPANAYAAQEGRELIQAMFVNPSYDCPPIELPKSITHPTEEFYPERLRL